MLVDVSPDQSMLDEGVAREVVNRIQKLRKKVKLTSYPSSETFLLSADNLCKQFRPN